MGQSAPDTSGSTGTDKINKQHEALKAETKWGKYSPEKQITTKQKNKTECNSRSRKCLEKIYVLSYQKSDLRSVKPEIRFTVCHTRNLSILSMKEK